MENKNVPLAPRVFTHERFGKLRVVVLDGIIFFVGKDVAIALGYQNPQKAIRDHVDPQDVRQGVELLFTPGGVQSTTLINKSGVYSLILDSNMPAAKEYRHWVTGELLPQVEEKGYYVKPEAELKCVYAFLMGNTLVKVGFTGDVKKRRKKITGVRRAYSSPFVTESEARDIERRIKEKFFAHKVAGEFYNITFEEAVAEIKSYFPAAPFDENKVRLLIDLLNVPIDCPEKTALFRRAANLLLEEKFF